MKTRQARLQLTTTTKKGQNSRQLAAKTRPKENNLWTREPTSVPHAWFLWLITLLLSFFLSFFFFWPDATTPPFFFYLFAKSVRNSLFLKRKSTQGKARVGHTNALFKCTFNLSLLRVFYPRERGDRWRSSLSLLFFTPASSASSSSRNEKKSQTLLSGRWRVKERGANSLPSARVHFFPSLCARFWRRAMRAIDSNIDETTFNARNALRVGEFSSSRVGVSWKVSARFRRFFFLLLSAVAKGERRRRQ